MHNNIAASTAKTGEAMRSKRRNLWGLASQFIMRYSKFVDSAAAAAGMPTAQAIKLIPAKAFISALNSAKLSEVSTAATPKIKTGIRNGAVIMMARKPLRGRPAMIAAVMAL